MDVASHAASLNIDFMVVGAMARDLVLVHGYGAAIERGTRDVDFAINVAGWDEFNALRNMLISTGYRPDSNRLHRLHWRDDDDLPWEIDIVPFGGIAKPNQTIGWPPDQAFIMNVHGFEEVFEHALQVQISKNPMSIISVASPPGVAVLKLVAWVDREVDLKSKDAADFAYLIQTYQKIPEIFDALYEQGFMEAQNWDIEQACAMKLGRDAGGIALASTKSFLNSALFDQPDKVEQFARDMQRQSIWKLVDCLKWLEIFSQQFFSTKRK